MVTPAMQEQPSVIYGPNGERAEWNGREYVVASPAAPAAGGYQLQPMVTPAEQRQREERQYDRERDVVRDQLTASREERAIEAARRSADTAERAAAKLTEDQGKAGGYATLMADAERSYQEALRQGFNPTALQNGFANFVEELPLVGGAAAFIRDDPADRARQAELQWTEANLKAMSGAASPDAEVVRNNITFFARPGQNMDAIGDRLEQARQVAFEASRRRGGSDLAGLQYPDGGDGQLRIRDLNPDETPEALAASGRIRGSDGVWRYPRDEQGNPIFPEGDGGGQPPAGPSGGAPTAGGDNGGLQRGVGGDGYSTALAQERANSDLIRPAAGVDMGLQFTAPFNDEMAYAEGFLRQGVGNIGRRLTGRGIEVSADDRGRASQDVMRQDQSRFAREHPGQNLAANVAGAAAFGPGAGAPGLVGRMAQGAGVGGTYGFAGADGSVTERLPSTALGLGLGAVAVPAVERLVAPVAGAIARPVINAVGSAWRGGARAAGGVGNALGVPGSQRLIDENALNPLASGMDRFADRMGPGRVNALNPNLATARANGLDDPTLVSVLDDGSIGRMRALGTRDTPGRDAALASAERRARRLPSRTARIAREEISADNRPALEIIDAQSDVRRANASAIDGFGNDAVPLGDDAVLALRSDFVRPHLRAAAARAQGATDPAEREASARLSRIADTVLDDPAGARLTVREAQDISKALNDAATVAYRAGSPDGPVLANLARTIRQTARDNSTGYASWLRQYGDDSDLIEAATTGRNFVSVSRDPANARGTEAFVRRAQESGPAELDIQRAASREAVEAAASNPSGAQTVLGGFASDVDQARRATAIGVDAERLQTRAAAELNDVTRHQRASPRVGSESSVNLQDAGDTAGVVMQAAANPLRAGASWVINRVASRGFSNAEAEAIVTAANNPAQTEQLIGMLAERMTRREARSLARAIRYQLTTNPPSAPQN